MIIYNYSAWIRVKSRTLTAARLAHETSYLSGADLLIMRKVIPTTGVA